MNDKNEAHAVRENAMFYVWEMTYYTVKFTEDAPKWERRINDMSGDEMNDMSLLYLIMQEYKIIDEIANAYKNGKMGNKRELKKNVINLRLSLIKKVRCLWTLFQDEEFIRSIENDVLGMIEYKGVPEYQENSLELLYADLYKIYDYSYLTPLITTNIWRREKYNPDSSILSLNSNQNWSFGY